MPRVCAYDLYPAPCSLGDELGGHRDVRGVGVETDYPPAGQDSFGEQFEDAARSAAEVDCAVAGAQSNAIQQGSALGCELVGLPLQASALNGVAAKGVDRVRIALYADRRWKVVLGAHGRSLSLVHRIVTDTRRAAGSLGG